MEKLLWSFGSDGSWAKIKGILTITIIICFHTCLKTVLNDFCRPYLVRSRLCYSVASLCLSLSYLRGLPLWVVDSGRTDHLVYVFSFSVFHVFIFRSRDHLLVHVKFCLIMKIFYHILWESIGLYTLHVIQSTTLWLLWMCKQNHALIKYTRKFDTIQWLNCINS